MNAARKHLMQQAAKQSSNISAANALAKKSHDKSHLVADPRTGVMKTFVERGSIFVPPKQKEIATLVDWVADHPAAKSSKSLRKLQEAYLESCGVL